jgi:hypothetical protein
VTFDGIPDVPLERFELRFDEGAASPITVTEDLCKAKRPPGLVSQLTAHNGKTVSLTPPIDVTGCKVGGAIRLRGLGGRKPSLALTLTTPPGAAPLRDVRLTLPRGLSAGTRRALRHGAKARGDGRRLKRPAARGRAVTVTGAGARKLTVGLSHGALRVSAGLRRKLARHPRLTFKVVVTDAGGGRSTLRLRVKASR